MCSKPAANSVTLRNGKYGKLIKVSMLYEFYLHKPMENIKSALHRYSKEKKMLLTEQKGGEWLDLLKIIPVLS